MVTPPRDYKDFTSIRTVEAAKHTYYNYESLEEVIDTFDSDEVVKTEVVVEHERDGYGRDLKRKTTEVVNLVRKHYLVLGVPFAVAHSKVLRDARQNVERLSVMNGDLYDDCREQAKWLQEVIREFQDLSARYTVVDGLYENAMQKWQKAELQASSLQKKLDKLKQHFGSAAFKDALGEE